MKKVLYIVLLFVGFSGMLWLTEPVHRSYEGLEAISTQSVPLAYRLVSFYQPADFWQTLVWLIFAFLLAFIVCRKEQTFQRISQDTINKYKKGEKY